MKNDTGITQYFDEKLAIILSDKIIQVHERFDKNTYVNAISINCVKLSYSQRIELHARQLRSHLPDDYLHALKILVSILGEENKQQTGMFSHFYWVLPIAKFIEIYGLDYFEHSMNAIEEVTKRGTGEYAVRPYIRKFPEDSIIRMTKWAQSDNFHLRRLASEGLRPKLPWAPKLDTFIDCPEPVFAILDMLKEDEVMFVKKSVANHLTDWLKVNKEPAVHLIRKWHKSENRHTQWIIKRATRKISVD